MRIVLLLLLIGLAGAVIQNREHLFPKKAPPKVATPTPAPTPRVSPAAEGKIRAFLGNATLGSTLPGRPTSPSSTGKRRRREHASRPLPASSW